MAPLNSLSIWSVRSAGGNRRPKSKCFFIGEGPNTEFWYLSGLAERLARMDVPELIELRAVERTGDEKGQSAPVKLLDHARKVKDDADGRFGFDPELDSVVVFFDADIYKGDEERYLRELKAFDGVADVAVTYPSFELFLLLHLDDAVAVRHRAKRGRDRGQRLRQQAQVRRGPRIGEARHEREAQQGGR